jgi:hypothetical protein
MLIFLKTLKVSLLCLVSGTNVSLIGAKLCSKVTATCDVPMIIIG